MKAISMWQPWATLWLLTDPDEKVFETRGWRTRVRGPLLVHAAQKRDGDVRRALQDPYFIGVLNAHGLKPRDLAFGAIIGKVELVDCKQMADLCDCWSPSEKEVKMGDWQPERYAWRRGPAPQLLQNPIRWRGKQGFFEVPESVINENIMSMLQVA